MFRYSMFLIGAISVALFCAAIAGAQLPDISDEYVFSGSGWVARPF